uniref:Gustatory receptor n=2 Tax=Anopheles albimanus TaxID=7167 RepID=A0A182G0E7_ANOAL
MSPQHKPRHIYEVLAPLYRFSRMAGVTAYHLKGEPPFVKVQVTSFDLFWFVVNLLLNGFCVYLNVANTRPALLTGSTAMDKGLGYLWPFGAIVSIALSIDNILRRRTTAAIIEELFAVDRSLQRKHHQINHARQAQVLTRILILSIVLLMIGTIFSILMSIASKFSFRSRAINTFSYVLTGCGFMVVNFHFICAGRIVAFRFNEVEQCFRKYLDSGQWWIVKKDRWGRKETTIDVIAALGDDFAALVRIVGRINRIYSNQIVACVSGVCLFSIFVIYACAFTYYRGSVQEMRLASIMFTAWLVYLIMICMIFHAGAEVSAAGRNMVNLINCALHREHDLDIRKKLTNLSQQLLLRPPKLENLFYEFNWKTMFGMFGFIVSYLVILMQFDTVSDNRTVDSV